MNLKRLCDAGIINEYEVVPQAITGSFSILKNGVPTYVVKESSNGKLRCNCVGFKYRQYCRHCELVDRYLGERKPKRRPREEFEQYLPDVESIFYGFKYQIVGSWRRGDLPDFKDIDCIVETDYVGFNEIYNRLSSDSSYINTMHGNDIIRGEYHGVLFDVRRVNENEWGATELFYTGSGKFNILMRGWVKSKGMKLNEHGLFASDGTLLASKTEEEIFSVLGLPYIAPKDRNDDYLRKIIYFIDKDSLSGSYEV